MGQKNFLLPSEIKDKVIASVSENKNTELLDLLTNLETNNNWSDRFKWWADLGKSLLVWGVVLFFTLKFLNKIDDNRNNARYRYQKMTELKINAVNSFKNTSQVYLFVGYDIYYKKDTGQLTYKNFKSVTYDQMHTDLKDLRRYFGRTSIMPKIDSFDNEVQHLFREYINPAIKNKNSIPDHKGYDDIYEILYRLRNEVIAQAMEILFEE